MSMRIRGRRTSAGLVDRAGYSRTAERADNTKVKAKPKPKRKAVKKKVVCKRVRIKGTKRYKKVCKPVKKKKKVVKKKPVTTPAAPRRRRRRADARPRPPAAPPVTTPPATPTRRRRRPPIRRPPPTRSSTAGTFGVAQAQRLLWRAGFGPKPGQAEALAAMGLQARRAQPHPADRRRDARRRARDAAQRHAVRALRRLGPRPPLVAGPDGALRPAARRAHDADLPRLVRDVQRATSTAAR